MRLPLYVVRMDPAEELDLDARFLLANERTLLAWVRTALALLAGGVAVQQVADDVQHRRVLALVLIGVGIATGVTGGVRYVAADKAMREGKLPVTGRAPYALVGVVVVIGVLAGVVVVLA